MTAQPERDGYVLIIGAMKSGTTTLFRLLAAHPEIAAATPKEPGFFAFDEIFARGRDWYEGLFGFDPDRHAWRLEGSTDYTKAPFVTGVRARIDAFAEAAPRPVRVKAIYVMRHPLRRIESHARHVQRTGREIGHHASPRPDHSLDAGLSLPALAMTRYAAQLDGWADLHAAGDLHLVTLEELTAAPDRVMGGIWDFLGLAPPAADGPAAPPAEGAAGGAARPIVRANAGDPGRKRIDDRWPGLAARHPRLVALGRALLPGGLRARIKRGFKRRVAPKAGRFELDPAEARALAETLRPDLARLHAVYGVDSRTVWNLEN